VAAFIHWLVNDSAWTVDENQHQTTIKPRHIAILFRRFQNFTAHITRPYVRALEARRIPHVLVGGRSFHDREEIIALRAAIAAIKRPDDELSVFATLRGPFFALGDEPLLLFVSMSLKTANCGHHLNPMTRIDQTALEPAAAPVVVALELLGDLHRHRNYRPIAQTISMFLEAVRAHAGIALWPNGEQALANCQRLVEMARQFERTASSFPAFLEKLESDAERAEADEAPIVEEGTEGIRLMTGHRAKGLQFPVVILADPTCRAARDTPSRHVDSIRRLWVEPLCGAIPAELADAAAEELKREEAEALRVAYVAATRARDLLVPPVCGDQPLDGWLSVLNPMLYPPDDARATSTPTPGCPEFGIDSVLSRGAKGTKPPGGSVRPGFHRLPDGGPSVVWWDPSKLVLEVDEPVPLRQQRILQADEQGIGTQSEADYAA
jgi:ATP-dependent exoDNAse (exonuclease V) beta subunit